MNDELMKQKYLKYKKKYILKKASLKKNNLEMQGGALTSANKGVHFVIICTNEKAIKPITNSITEKFYQILKTSGYMSKSYKIETKYIKTTDDILNMLKSLKTNIFDEATKIGSAKVDGFHTISTNHHMESNTRVIDTDIYYARVGDKYITHDLGNNMNSDTKGTQKDLTSLFLNSDINYTEISAKLGNIPYTAFEMYTPPDNVPILVSINTVNGKEPSVFRTYKQLLPIDSLKKSTSENMMKGVGSAASNVLSGIGTFASSMDHRLT